MERLINIVKDSGGRTADELLNYLKENIKSFSNDTSFDDMTLLVLNKEA